MDRKILYLLLIVIVGVQGGSKEKWKEFKSKFNKSYGATKEDYHRFRVFKRNLQIMEKHNKQYNEGLVSYNMSFNKFMDLTEEEFSKRYDVDETPIFVSYYFPDEMDLSNITDDELPAEFDWRKYGAVTSVKDQDDPVICGSCWAFSAVGTLEALHYRKTKNLISLSAQNLVDCTYSELNKNTRGCLGGGMDQALLYVEKYGIATEKHYPYTATSGNCNRKQEKALRINGFKVLLPGDERSLRKSVVKHGPIAVSINLTPKLQFYHKGIFFDKDCSIYSLLHGVLVIGYGTENGTDYWLVKNSWGTSWGDEGYFKIMRNRNNHCDIATEMYYPF